MSNTNLIKSLNVVLADTFTLYFKTHSFHWNVTGPRFHSLHEMFEEQYTEIWGALDDLAERVRQLGAMAPDNPTDMAKGATLSPAGQTPDAESMVEILANDNRAIVETLKKAANEAAEADDPATEDMLIERIQAHSKYAWMLESSAA